MKIVLKRKTFYLLFLLILCSCKPIAIRKYRAFRDISLAKVQVNKVLSIGIRDDFPPFTSRNKHTDFLEGFDIELARLVCLEMGVMADFKVIDWSKKEELLRQGEIDCIWGAYPKSQGIKADLTLTKPYIKSCYVIGVLDSSYIKSIDDLDNKTLAVQTGSTTSTALEEVRRQKFKTIRESYHKNFRFCTKELDAGNVDGVIEDFLVINYLINEENKPYRFLEDALSLESYCIAFRNNDLAVAKKIQQVLNDLEYRDLTAPLSIKWFGSNFLIIGK